MKMNNTEFFPFLSRAGLVYLCHPENPFQPLESNLSIVVAPERLQLHFPAYFHPPPPMEVGLNPTPPQKHCSMLGTLHKSQDSPTAEHRAGGPAPGRVSGLSFAIMYLSHQSLHSTVLIRESASH